jgi:hypothetical protein
VDPVFRFERCSNHCESIGFDAVARRIEPFDDGPTMLTSMMFTAMTSKSKTVTTAAKTAD